MATKVIVVGGVNGQFQHLFPKLAALHSKNTFSSALLLGDVFAAPSDDEATSTKHSLAIDSLLRGEIPVALPTYFTVGAHALPTNITERIDSSNGEVCENLFYLGKRGVLKTSDGIRIVALGGQLDANLRGTTLGTPEANAAPFYSPTDAAALKGANHADILLTYDLPEGVTMGSTAMTLAATHGNSHIAELAAELRPRYHFVPSPDGRYHEREPYQNGFKSGDREGETRVTRFVALAGFGNAEKEKALYAFVMALDEPQTIPEGCTPSPYDALAAGKKSKKRKESKAPSGAGTFFWGDHTSQQNNNNHNNNKRRRHDMRPPPGPDQCFFCLSNKQIEKHLIVAIGDDAYVTMAKGPLTNASTNPPALKDASSHVLIIPFAHTPTLQAIDDDESRIATQREMHRYRHALERMFAAHGCGTVTFEIRRKNGVHAHFQVVPVKKELMPGVDAAFAEGLKHDHDLGPYVGEEEVAVGEDAFVYWNSDRNVEGETEAEGEHRGGRAIKLGDTQYFDLQFGRRVMAEIVGAGENRVYWKDCVLDHDGEVKDTEAFKKLFREYDFS